MKLNQAKARHQLARDGDNRVVTVTLHLVTEGLQRAFYSVRDIRAMREVRPFVETIRAHAVHAETCSLCQYSRPAYATGGLVAGLGVRP